MTGMNSMSLTDGYLGKQIAEDTTPPVYLGPRQLEELDNLRIIDDGRRAARVYLAGDIETSMISAIGAKLAQAGVQADGGYTVIPELDKEIMRQLQDDSVMRSIATVKTTKTNEYQKLVSVGGAVVKHGAEGEARAETTTPRMERVDIKLSPIYAYPKTTQEILDFSEVDILGWLSSEISDTFSATEENDFVNGDGVKKAKGFLAYDRVSTSDKTRPFGTLEKMETAAVNSDGLIDLLYKLKAKYRKNAVWVMNSNTAATLQKLKNDNGDYIWRDRLVADSPDTLLGRPVQYLETMPDAAPGEAFLAVTWS